MAEENKKINEENLRCEYDQALEIAHHSDGIINEVAAVVWGANTLLLGFILEVPCESDNQKLVVVASFVGLLMSLYVPFVHILAKRGQKIAYHTCREIEKELPFKYKLHTAIHGVYPKRKPGWIAILVLSVVFVCAWGYVVCHARACLMKSVHSPSDRKDEAATQPPTKPVIVVPEKPPWWDVTWSTWGLFGVGLGGTVAAIWTLFIVKRQGKDIKTTAEAALLNAKAIINAERAWIDAELIKKISMGVTQYDLVITNHGKTPARLCGYGINYGRPSEDGTWSLETLKGKFSKRIEIFLGSERSTTLPDFDIGEMFANLPDSSLRPQVVAGFVFFTISYADVVVIESEQIGGRETFFGYQYNVLLGSLERQPIFTRYT